MGPWVRGYARTPLARWQFEHTHLGTAGRANRSSPMGEAGANPALSRNCDADEGLSHSSASQITHPGSVTFPSRQLGADTFTTPGRRCETRTGWMPPSSRTFPRISSLARNIAGLFSCKWETS